MRRTLGRKDAGEELRTKLTTALLLTLASMVLVACNGRTDSQAFVLRGPVDAATYRAFLEFRDHTPDRPIQMIVQSAGGDARWAMRLGDAMLGGGVNLRIEGVCQSACAQYLLPSAATIIVAPGSSIGFHSSPADLQLPVDAPPEAHAALTAFTAAETRFYARRGIDARTVAALRAERQPICRMTAFPGADLSGYAVAARFVVAVPSPAAMRSMGYPDVAGYWPVAHAAAVADAAKAGFNTKLTIHYVDQIVVPTGPRLRLPPCPVTSTTFNPQQTQTATPPPPAR